MEPAPESDDRSRQYGFPVLAEAEKTPGGKHYECLAVDCHKQGKNVLCKAHTKKYDEHAAAAAAAGNNAATTTTAAINAGASNDDVDMLRAKIDKLREKVKVLQVTVKKQRETIDELRAEGGQPQDPPGAEEDKEADEDDDDDDDGIDDGGAFDGVNAGGDHYDQVSNVFILYFDLLYLALSIYSRYLVLLSPLHLQVEGEDSDTTDDDITSTGGGGNWYSPSASTSSSGSVDYNESDDDYDDKADEDEDEDEEASLCGGGILFMYFHFPSFFEVYWYFKALTHWHWFCSG